MENYFLTCWLGEKLFGLPLSIVDRVVRALEVTPLPEAPKGVVGLINLAGEAIPLLDMGPFFHIDHSPIQLNHRFIIFDSSTGKRALWVDSVEEIRGFSSETISEPQTIFSELKYLQKVLALPDGLMLIPEIDQLVSQQSLENLALENLEEGQE